MTQETTPLSSRPRVPLVLGIATGILAVLAAMAGCLPNSVLQQFASKIRHPGDLNFDRYQRYLQISWFFAVSLGAASVGCFRYSARLQLLLSSLLQQVRALRSEIRSFVVNLPPVVWTAILAGACVRVWFLNLPMAYDESYSFINYASRPVYLSIADYNATNNHLFNTFLMHGMYRVFGQQDWALRIPACCFGIAMLPIVWGWARDRFTESVANLTTSLVAISPSLVSYSVNARGYIYLTCCAVLLDWAFFRIASRDENHLALWSVAWGAVVIGAWSMPLMVYPAIGISAWFVLIPLFSNEDRGATFRRLRSLIPFGISAVYAVIVFYAPAYLLRGTMFLDKVGFDEPSFPVWFEKLPSVLSQAVRWWLPMPVWLQFAATICVAIGLISLFRKPKLLGSLLAPFAVALILISLQQVSPPPRVFLYLAPWAALFCARGTVAIVERISERSRIRSALSLSIVLGGTVYLLGRPFLFEEHERIDYDSVPSAIDRLQSELQSSETEQHRLFAPLPCDLPALYYMDKLGFRIPVNGVPQPSEMLWLLARPEQTPSETLSTPLIGLRERSAQFGPWEIVATFETLVLYRSTRSTQPEQSRGF